MGKRVDRLLALRIRTRVPGSWLLWALAPVLVLLFVWQLASLDRLVVDLERERDMHQGLESQVNALRLEANRLSSLGEVETRASRDLGLLRPDTDQIVDLVFENDDDPPVRLAFQPLVGEARAGTRGDR
jgi:cell division protein FtsL